MRCLQFWFEIQQFSLRMFRRMGFLIKDLGGKHSKVQWVVLATLQVKSASDSCNEILILRPFNKAAKKT